MARGAVFFPGAGSSREHSSLLAIEVALHPVPVIRADFPYRIAGRKIPDRAPVLVQAVRDVVRAACERWSCGPEELVIGGRSMGGRMCSMAVAGADGNERSVQPVADPLKVAGLVCVSYPLHPPQQPTRLRVAHLPLVAVPSLFVSGTRDEFATEAELRTHLSIMPVAPSLHLVDGSRHDLRGKDEVVAAAVAAWVGSLAN